MSFTIIPAIDVREGQVVRLIQGDYNQQTTYAAAPLQQAITYYEQGAEFLHLVDLDAARLGGFSLQALISDIRKHTGLRIQAGGGIRNREMLESVLHAGAERVVVGTLALSQQELVQQWIRDFGIDAITLAFDVRNNDQNQWLCASHGWTDLGTQTLNDVISLYQNSSGLRHVLCTDIQRDGLLTGYNAELYRQLKHDWPELHIQASGGVNCIAEISQIKQLGITGAILGRALLEGKFQLNEALAC